MWAADRDKNSSVMQKPAMAVVMSLCQRYDTFLTLSLTQQQNELARTDGLV
jgi:hypothetical protein